MADFADVDEMNADGPARKGRRAAVGLAVRITKSVASGNTRGSGKHVPRSAKEAADLVVESMTTKGKEEQKGNSRLFGVFEMRVVGPKWKSKTSMFIGSWTFGDAILTG